MSNTSLSPRASAKRLIESLVERGVDVFFGIPGGPVCPVFDAIRCTPGAKLLESRHETHAAFAAALYHRASGKVPAVVVTAGPGATNAATGVASANLERIPMLVIAGDVASATSGGCLLQDSGPEGIDVEAMFAPITCAQQRAAHAKSAVTQALAALDAATFHKRPALFVLPLDRAMHECDPVPMRAPQIAVAAPPHADDVTEAARLLSSAQRPIVVLGGGCRGHEVAVHNLVTRLNLPFVTTPRAKGVVSERHPRALRNGGMAASLWARRYTAEPVDVCLALGTDLDDVSVGPTPYLGAGGKLIHVDLDARVIGRNLPTALAVIADVGAFAEALAKHPIDNPQAHRALEAAKSGAPFDVAAAHEDPSRPLKPHRAVLDLEAAAGKDACFVTDIGEHMLFALHYLTANHNFFIQLNLGSMGSGIAGAIGLALANRARRVICICGDGGMQMAGMEALVAVRERLPILFAVFNDGRYNMVHHGMKQIFGDASTYDMPFVDFSVWASSFGMPSTRITEPSEINASLVETLLSEGPGLLDIRIDADLRIKGGGRIEALQHMSMLSQRGAV